MKHTLNMMAFDLGASNGRAILGRFDGEKIVMEELHRYENDYVRLGGKLYWDCLNLYQQMKQGFHAFRRADAGELASFGVDTWGVDYGLLDRNGCLLGNPRSYRMSEDADMERVYQTVPFETLFARSGIGAMNFNTLFQLCRRRAEGDVALEQAETMLLMPDLLGYFFTGEKKSEYTIASTTMLYNPLPGRLGLGDHRRPGFAAAYLHRSRPSRQPPRRAAARSGPGAGNQPGCIRGSGLP